MSKELRRSVVLVVMIVAQLAVPAWMILAREQVLDKGEVYRFRTAPVDPYDAFRGRYVALAFDAANATVPTAPGQDLGEGGWERGQTAYVELGTDAAGFARLVALHRRPPQDGASLKAKVLYGEESGATIHLPFDRYYLPEDLAPAAEAAYRNLSRGDRKEAWVEVRVLRGRAVIEELMVGGEPILDFVRNQQP